MNNAPDQNNPIHLEWELRPTARKTSRDCGDIFAIIPEGGTYTVALYVQTPIAEHIVKQHNQELDKVGVSK